MCSIEIGLFLRKCIFSNGSNKHRKEGEAQAGNIRATDVMLTINSNKKLS